MNRDTSTHVDRGARQGFALGVAAYGLWGVLPVYFKALRSIDSVDIVAHRIVWSAPVLAALLSFSGTWGEVREALRNRRVVILLTITALLIGGNWLLYVYAVNSGHILAGSLGYYLNPLANVLLGRIVLKERLSWLQWAAVALAAAGISALAIGALGQLWISLTLCASFATYGLLRKIAPVDAVAGLAIETAILFPFAAGWLLWGFAAGTPIFGTSQFHVVLIAFAGVITATPLLLFTAAAKRLLFDAGHAPVPCPYPAVPARRLALRRAVHERSCDRVRRYLGCARTLCPCDRPPCSSVGRLAGVRNIEQCPPLLCL